MVEANIILISTFIFITLLITLVVERIITLLNSNELSFFKIHFILFTLIHLNYLIEASFILMVSLILFIWICLVFLTFMIFIIDRGCIMILKHLLVMILNLFISMMDAIMDLDLNIS
jgi:hypothetical protein